MAYNPYFIGRIIDLCEEFPKIGIRISIEGLEKTNDSIRGLDDGFHRGYSTLKELREMGMKDVGFGMTVQDRNAAELVPLYRLSDEMGMESAPGGGGIDYRTLYPGRVAYGAPPSK